EVDGSCRTAELGVLGLVVGAGQHTGAVGDGEPVDHHTLGTGGDHHLVDAAGQVRGHLLALGQVQHVETVHRHGAAASTEHVHPEHRLGVERSVDPERRTLALRQVHAAGTGDISGAQSGGQVLVPVHRGAVGAGQLRLVHLGGGRGV